MLAFIKLLSDREREVFELMASLETNAEIAEALVVSTNTVKYHLKNIYTKLGAENRDDVINLAREVVRKQRQVHRLPQQIDRFIGRERELDAITSLIFDGRHRLVTLTGIGGVGKTRLAIETAHRLSNQFADGVYFVNLIQKHSVEALMMALYDVLGFALNPDGGSIRDEVLDFLREKSALLIFDNVGDVQNAATFVVDLLEYCLDIQVLVTSRERLHVYAETVFQVEGISLDEAGNQRSEAADLFIEAAERIKPDMTLQEQDLHAIKEICNIMGGLPLAIIIAASWVSSLPISDIPQELRSDLNLLEIDYQDLPPRHRSLLDLFRRQLNQLDPGIQETITQLTVFVSGFTREAASNVVGAPLTDLRKLTELSFLTYDDSADIFHFHPLIRQFIEKYSIHDQVMAPIIEAHSRYYAQLLLTEVASTSQVSRLPNSLENIVTGWKWACVHQQDQLIHDYLAGLYVYGQEYGWSRFGANEQQTFELILQGQHSTSNDNHGYTYLCLAGLHQYKGENAQAMACVRAGIELNAEKPLAHILLARLLLLKSSLLMGRREYASALTVLDDVEKVVAQPHDPLERRLWIDMQLSRSSCYYWQNDLDALGECIDALESKVERYGTWVQQADLWHRKSTLDFRLHGSNTSTKAIQFSRRSLEICQQIGSPNWVMQRKFSLGFLHLWAGQFELAEDYLLQACSEGEYLGLRDYLRYPYAYLSVLYRFRDDSKKVTFYTNLLDRQARDLMDNVYLGIVLANRAWLASKTGIWKQCVDYGRRALDSWHDTAYPMQWLACFPLIKALHQLELYEQIPPCIHIVERDSQQQLTPGLHQDLETIQRMIENAVSGNPGNLPPLIKRVYQYIPRPIPLGE